MGDFWLFGAMLLCSVVGYRVATHQGLSGITGVGLSLVLCAVLGTDLWDRLVIWYHGLTASDLITHLGVVVVAASAAFFIEKLKLYAFIKVLGMMLPVSFTSVRAPEIAMSNYQAPSANQKVEFVADVPVEGKRILKGEYRPQSRTLLGFLEQAFAEVSRAGREFERLARVSTDTLLYKGLEGELVRSSVVVPEGTWVVAEEEVVDKTGQRWLRVSMRTRTGQQEGYIPVSKVGAESETPPAAPSANN